MNNMRSYKEIVDDFLDLMIKTSPFNSVEWVRFKGIQIEDYIKRTPEYISKSGGNHYLYREERYRMKSSIKRWLKNKGCKFDGNEYKIAKHLL
jgi:hypothetical protein